MYVVYNFNSHTEAEGFIMVC